MRFQECSRTALISLLAATAIGACDRQATTPVAKPPATESTLESATLLGLDGLPDAVKLVDGVWTGEPYVEGGSTYPSVRLSPGYRADGDLDADGGGETVAVVIADTGGTGRFYYLVLFSESDGVLKHMASELLGDRVQVESVGITNGVVEVVQIEQGDDDAMCCPTQRVERRYAVEGDSLVPASEVALPERVWGYLVWGHENRSFKSCDADREAWVVDSSTGGGLAGLYEELAIEAYEPVFIDVSARWLGPHPSGFGEQFEETLDVLEIYRMEREGWGCRLDIEGIVFRGWGNEPSWRLDVRSNAASVTSPDGTSTWEDGGKAGDNEWLFENDGSQISIVYREQPCRDSMSGSWFSHTVEYRLGTDEFQGCAVPGGLDEPD